VDSRLHSKSGREVGEDGAGQVGLKGGGFGVKPREGRGERKSGGSITILKHYLGRAESVGFPVDPLHIPSFACFL